MQEAARDSGELMAGCVIRKAARAPLVVADGRELYVEPVALEPSDGELLLAGVPNYLWKRATPGGLASEVTADSVFGAVIARDGRARIVPSPVDARLVASVRALGRGDGHWEVVFAELDRPTPIGETATAVRYWYGVFDGSRWSPLEVIPIPPDARPNLANPAPLVRRGDTLSWVTSVTTNGLEREALVYERRNGRWSYEFVPTHFAAYPHLTASDAGSLVLALVRADLTIGRDQNSLFLFVRRGGWREHRKLIAGGREPVHVPTLSLTPSPGVLTWSASLRTPDPRWEARAIVGPLEIPSPKVITLDSSITMTTPAMILEGPTRVWVTEHVSPTDPTQRELRFLTDNSGSAVILARSPSPVLGPFAAAAPTPTEIVVAGPLADRTPGKPAVITLLIRARVECSARQREP